MYFLRQRKAAHLRNICLDGPQPCSSRGEEKAECRCIANLLIASRVGTHWVYVADIVTCKRFHLSKTDWRLIGLC